MDASKFVGRSGDRYLGISIAADQRARLADALRDLADELEAGTRIVSLCQTNEVIGTNCVPTSILLLHTSKVKAP
jgi:hypothetical protein